MASIDDFLGEKKQSVSQSFKALEDRRAQDLIGMYKLQGQYELIEELEQHLTPNIKDTPTTAKEKKSGK